MTRTWLPICEDLTGRPDTVIYAVSGHDDVRRSHILELFTNSLIYLCTNIQCYVRVERSAQLEWVGYDQVS